MAIDLPALVGGALVGGAFLSFPKTASILEFVSGLFFSVLLWLTIGSRLSNRPHRDVIIGLSLFYGMALLGAIAPLGYTGFLPVGIVTWVLFAFWLRSGRAHASSANETPFGQA